MTAAEAGKADFPRAAARAVRSLHAEDFCDALLALVQQAAGFDTAMIFTLRDQGAPSIHHDRLASEERAAFYGPWLAGVYLLSPFYRALRDAREDGFYRVRALAPEGFRTSEYYRQYYRHTGSSDLGGFLVGDDPGVRTVVTIGRHASAPRFSRVEIARLEALVPLVAALVRGHWSAIEQPPPASAEHRRPVERLAGFGAGLLTDREREVLYLLFRGHSAKAMARVLGISPETARVHRRHLYAKLGVGSQGELFSRVMTAVVGN